MPLQEQKTANCSLSGPVEPQRGFGVTFCTALSSGKKNELEMIFTLKNSLEMIFIIEMHWK